MERGLPVCRGPHCTGEVVALPHTSSPPLPRLHSLCTVCVLLCPFACWVRACPLHSDRAPQDRATRGAVCAGEGCRRGEQSLRFSRPMLVGGWPLWHTLFPMCTHARNGVLRTDDFCALKTDHNGDGAGRKARRLPDFPEPCGQQVCTPRGSCVCAGLLTPPPQLVHVLWRGRSSEPLLCPAGKGDALSLNQTKRKPVRTSALVWFRLPPLTRPHTHVPV